MRHRAIAAIALIAMFVVAAPAHAQGKGGGPRVDAAISFTMSQSWLYETESVFFTEKGPIDCPRCGTFTVKVGSGDKVESIKLKKTRNEKVVSAFYNYMAFDGSGVYVGKGNWSGRTTLPARMTALDAEGVSHDVYLVNATVLVRERTSPLPTRTGLPPAN